MTPKPAQAIVAAFLIVMALTACATDGIGRNSTHVPESRIISEMTPIPVESFKKRGAALREGYREARLLRVCLKDRKTSCGRFPDRTLTRLSELHDTNTEEMIVSVNRWINRYELHPTKLL